MRIRADPVGFKRLAASWHLTVKRRRTVPQSKRSSFDPFQKTHMEISSVPYTGQSPLFKAPPMQLELHKIRAQTWKHDKARRGNLFSKRNPVTPLGNSKESALD